MSASNARESISLYRSYSLEAAQSDQPSLALRWRLAADAASLFLRQEKGDTPSPKSEEPSPSLFWKHHVLATQEAAAQMIQGLLAAAQEQTFRAEQWSTTAHRTTEAASCYEHWMGLLKKTPLHSLRQKRNQALQEADSYRREALLLENEKNLSQEWAEAACLAQDAASKFKKAQQLQESSEDKPCFLHCKIAAQEALHAAHLKAHLARAIAVQDKQTLPFLKAAASWGEEAMMDRGRVFLASQAGDEERVIHWSLLAAWASRLAEAKMKSSALHASLCSFNHWEEAAEMIEKAFIARREAQHFSKNKKKILTLNQELFFLEYTAGAKINNAEKRDLAPMLAT